MKKTIVYFILFTMIGSLLVLGNIYLFPVNYKPIATEIRNEVINYHDVKPAWLSQVEVIPVEDYMQVFVGTKDGKYIKNSHQAKAASMIKVFILATAMEDYKEGKIDLNNTITLQATDKVGGAGSLNGAKSGSSWTINQLLYKMITESDNTATNMIIDYLGMDHINDYIKTNGYNDTFLQRKMMDIQAAKAGRENFTSANDLGIIFTKIANGKCVGEKEDKMMVDMLKDQTDTEVLPGVISATIAHKTGELSGVYHDGGIVYYGGNNNYIIVLMTNNYPYRSKAIQDMQAYGAKVDHILRN